MTRVLSTPRTVAAALCCLGVFTVTVIGTTGTAQGTPPDSLAAKAPVFTKAQVTLGQRVYTQSCQGCHGAQLQGARSPALVGKVFLSEWADGKRPASALHQYIAQKMPLNKPGSLTPAQALNVTAYVLAQNGYQAGKKRLTTTNLKVPLAPPPAP